MVTLETESNDLASRPPREPTRRLGLSVVTVGAVVLLALQFLIRFVLGHDGFFSLDDFVFYNQANHSELWNKDFLLTPYNGHLMPGAMAWVWVSTKIAPLDYGLVLWTMMILQLVAGILMYLLLRVLFGNRPAILVPLAVFSFSTITLPASLWWAAGLNQLPQQISMILVIIFHVLYMRSGRRLLAFMGPLALILGLLFFEKTAVVVPLIGLMTWLFFSEGLLIPSLWTALRRYWLTWVAYLAVLIPFVIYYLANVPDQTKAEPTTENFAELFDSVIRQAILPGIVGGPWRWSDTGVVDSNADPHPLMQVVAVVAIGAVVTLSVMLRRVAIRAWVLAALFLLMLTVVLTVTRGAVIGAIVIGSEYRYLTEFALVVALCGGLAFLQTRIAPWWRKTPADPDADVLPAHVGGIPTMLLVSIAVIALIGSSTYSAYLFTERWTANPAKTYVKNATTTMKDLGPHDRIYNGVVPTRVIWRLLFPSNLPTNLLGPLGLKAQPFGEGESGSRLRQFNKVGQLEEAQVQGVGTSLFETKDCLVNVKSEPREVPLTSTIFEWPWIMQIDYVADKPGDLVIDAGGTRTTASIGSGTKGPGGRQSVYAAVQGGYDSITLAAPDNEFCIKTLAIGAPQPNEW